MERPLPWLEPLAAGVALVVLGWTTGAVAGPALGALTLAGVIAGGRALLPKDPVAGVIGALLLALAPPFRTAAAEAGPDLLAACGSVWALACVLAHARAPSLARTLAALVATGAVVAGAPWLGLAGLALVAHALWQPPPVAGTRTAIVAATAGIVALAIGAGLAGWLELRAPAPSLTAVVAASGIGSASVVIGAGLLGAAFAAVTALPRARTLAMALGLVATHAIAFDPAPAPLLALLAVAIAVIPGAIVRAVGSPRRAVVALAAGLPLVIAALATGPALGLP